MPLLVGLAVARLGRTSAAVAAALLARAAAAAQGPVVSPPVVRGDPASCWQLWPSRLTMSASRCLIILESGRHPDWRYSAAPHREAAAVVGRERWRVAGPLNCRWYC